LIRKSRIAGLPNREADHANPTPFNTDSAEPRRAAHTTWGVRADSGGSRPRIRDDVAHHSEMMSLGVPRWFRPAFRDDVARL